MYGVGCLGDSQNAAMIVSCQEACFMVLALFQQLADVLSPQRVQWHKRCVPAVQTTTYNKFCDSVDTKQDNTKLLCLCGSCNLNDSTAGR